jgi:hypothetical protein
MDLLALKKSIPVKYFDYQRLRQAIVGQVNERRFIGRLIKKGHVLRIKKGLYVWSEELEPAGYANEVLSNLIYGPSYVSLEYALSFYGLIPERVETLTAVTFQKNKTFRNPAGSFEYVHLYKGAYAVGITLHALGHDETCLMASPEKALLDTIALRVKKIDANTPLSQLLHDDMRIEQEEFAKLNVEALHQYGALYRSTAVKKFLKEVHDG